jgi:hypothetical protein
MKGDGVSPARTKECRGSAVPGMGVSAQRRTLTMFMPSKEDSSQINSLGTTVYARWMDVIQT